MALIRGTIKSLVKSEGFGFIETFDERQYFFHQSACGVAKFHDLRVGQRVKFEPGEGPKGPRVLIVRVEEIGQETKER